MLSHRSKTEDLKNSRLVLQQWVFFLASRKELDLGLLEENVQAVAFDPSTVFYWFVFLAFSENNVLERFFFKKDLQLEYIISHNLLHARCKMVNSI